MALLGHASTNHDPIRATLHRVQNEQGIEPAGAGHLGQVHVFWQVMVHPILILRGVEAPLTLKQDDFFGSIH
jgi:hypothetical protein